MTLTVIMTKEMIAKTYVNLSQLFDLRPVLNWGVIEPIIVVVERGLWHFQTLTFCPICVKHGEAIIHSIWISGPDI